MILALILGFAALGSIGAIVVVAGGLFVSKRVTDAMVPHLVSYAVGTLLGAAFIGMIPRAAEQLAVPTLMLAVLAGLIAFYVLERIVIWRHCHEEHCQTHTTTAVLILVGDAFHNLVDGIVIAAAFLTSVPLGISTSLAVIAHEIPQEAGDFGILLQAGYSRRKAFLCNALSSSTTLFGAVLGYAGMSALKPVVPYVLAVSAASFIYIALADLIPGRRAQAGAGALALELALLLLGLLTIWMFHAHR
jgi:zinc and cadmium transporter